MQTTFILGTLQKLGRPRFCLLILAQTSLMEQTSLYSNRTVGAKRGRESAVVTDNKRVRCEEQDFGQVHFRSSGTAAAAEWKEKGLSCGVIFKFGAPYTCKSVREAGYSWGDILEAGYSVDDLKDAGCSLTDACEAERHKAHKAGCTVSGASQHFSSPESEARPKAAAKCCRWSPCCGCELETETQSQSQSPTPAAAVGKKRRTSARAARRTAPVAAAASTNTAAGGTVAAPFDVIQHAAESARTSQQSRASTAAASIRGTTGSGSSSSAAGRRLSRRKK